MTRNRSVLGLLWALSLAVCGGACSSPSVPSEVPAESRPSAGLAAVIHVAPNGDDANPGTIDAPVASLQRAVDLAAEIEVPGEIVVQAGVYGGDVVIAARGNPPPLTIRAATAADGSFVDAIIDGSQRIEQAFAVPGSPGVYTIPLRRAHARNEYSVWEENTRIRYRPMAHLDTLAQVPGTFLLTDEAVFFHTSDGRPPEAHRIGVAWANRGLVILRAAVTVRGLQFRHFLLQRSSAGVMANAAGVTIEDCRVWNARRGVSLGTEARDTRIVRLRADDVGNGVFTYGVDTGVEESVFLRRPGPFEVQDYSQDQSGFQAYAPARGGTARRNLVVGFNLGLFFKCPASRFVAEYNTVVGMGDSQYGIGCTHWYPESVFRYNVVAGFRDALLTGFPEALLFDSGAIMDANAIWQPERGEPVLAQVRESGNGAANINADPLFADAEQFDFRLHAESPAAALAPGDTPAGAMGLADASGPYLLKPVAGANLDHGAAAHPADAVLAATEAAFVPHGGSSRDWVVDPVHGTDEPVAGTAERPLRSLQLALNHANPGDRVVLRPGIYLGSFRLGHGGTEDAPILIEAPDGGAILDGAKTVDDVLTLENAPHVEVRGLEIRWFMDTGLRIVESPRVQVFDCVFWNNEWGIRRRIGTGLRVIDSPGFVVERSLFFALNNGLIVLRSPRFRIEHVTVTEVLHRSIWLIRSASESVFRNNSFTFGGNDNLSIVEDGGLEDFDCDYNNLAAHIRDVAPRRPAPEEDIRPIPGDWFERNVCKAVVTLNREGFFSLREWREATGKDLHSIYAHPRYADPANRDFRLHAESPNIGAGKDGATIGALGIAGE